MKCFECGADIYEGVKKCPYCKTLIQDVKDDEKFRNFDFKYTISSPDQMEKIRESVKSVKKSSGKKGGLKSKLEKLLADRRAAKRAARRAVRRGEDPATAVSVKEETNPFLRNTEVKDMGDEQVAAYTRVKKEEKPRTPVQRKSSNQKPKMQFKFPRIDFKKINFKTGNNNILVRRIVGLGVVTLALVLVIWGAAALFGAIFGGEDVASSYAYVKNNSLYVVYNGKVVEASDSVILEDYLQKASIEGTAVSADTIAKTENIIHTTENGKVTYFFEDYDPDTDSGTLCMLKNGNAKKIKIVSDAVHNSIVMTENGEKILYLKSANNNGEMGVLHYWKNGMEEPFKITTDIDKTTFDFSQNGEWAVFIQNLIREKSSGDLYAKSLKNLKEEKEKVETGVCRIFGSGKDGKTHIYGKDYNPTDKTFDVYAVDKKGNSIRLGEKTAIDPVVMKTKNNVLVLGNDEDGKQSTNNLYIVEIKSGKKEKIDSGVSDVVKMSEDEKIIVYRKVYDSAPAVADYFAYVKGKQADKIASNVVIEETVVTGIPQIAISDDCKNIIYISDFEAMKGGGTLHMTEFKNGKADSEKIAENVYSCHITGEDRFVFTKDYSTAKKMFDVYTLDGDEPKLLREEVYPRMFGVSVKGNNIYYVSDYNVEGAYGNLQRMDIKGKSKEIDSKVAGFSLTSTGDVLVYKNVDSAQGRYDLYLIKNGKKESKELDKSVFEILQY